LAYLSSLREISVVDTLNGDDDKMQVIPVNVEPTFVALGPKHVAVGMNIRIWLYRYGDREEQSRQSRNPPLVEPERQFPGNISAIRLNAKYVAVLCEGRVHLSVIEPKRGTTEQDTKIFNVDGGGQITCMALTEDMLIYGFVSGGARGGGVKFFSLADWLPLEGIEHRHETSITSIVPSPSGTRMIFIDVSGRGWLYNPADTSTLEIPNFKDERGLTSSGQPIKCALWDPVGDQDGKSRSLSGTQSQCFVTVEGGQFWTYVYSQLHFEGPTITRVGRVEINPDSGDMIQEALSTDVPHGSSPAVVRNGRVTCQHQSGALDTIVLNTHSNIRVSGGRGGARNIERLTECFKQRLCMLRLRDAWEIALQLNNRSLWLALSGKSMEHLDIGLAVQVYRDIGDAAMVQSLERIKRIEDRQLLSGHVHLLFSQFEEAQERFLASSRPETALEMRRDLLNWDHALKLAGSIAPDQVPTISYEYGQQLEFKGEYALALKMYGSACTEIQTTLTELELGVDNGSSSNKSLGGGSSKLADLMMQQYGSKSSYDYEDAVSELKNKLKQCTAGLTRMTIRQGDLRRGILMANESNDKALCRECGSVLESMKQYGDAARMYEKGGSLEKAASIYIQTKDFDSAKPLMSMIKTAKLHSQYAKAKEAVRDFRAAVSAYERARDMDSVVRLYIDQLNEPELAFAIVRSTASSNAAQMVARYCTSKANWQGAIEFLLMAQRSEEAFQLAKEHDEMGVYATALGDEGSTTEYSAIARFYESKNEQGRAGQFYAKCGQYMKALNLYLDCGEREMDRAIDVVGKARSDMLTHTLIDYLMGERDGEPKDPNHIYRLYVALGNYERASATAVLISKQERELGNYKISHYQLYTTMSEMRNQGVRVPSELRNAFLLLHSYVLVKKLVKMGKHVVSDFFG
jgi:WD repeat-containing protein 19